MSLFCLTFLDGDCSGYYVGMFGYINVSGLQDGELDTPPELLGGHDLRMSFHVMLFPIVLQTNTNKKNNQTERERRGRAAEEAVGQRKII